MAHHEITVQAGSSTLTLMRCGHCSQQAWTIDGRSVQREEAFAHLSGAYRDLPQAAQATRTKAAADREARRAARDALTPTDNEIQLPDETVPSELATLLEGWQVLGAVR